MAMRSLVRSPVVGFLKEKQIPFVVIGPGSDKEVLSVGNDHRSACRDMTAYLIARSVRRMALIGGDDNNCVPHSRLEGFWDACDQAGVLARKADCIVCMDDYLCNLVLIHLRTSGVRIPQDVKVVSFYANPLPENNIPAITSLRFDAAELGKIACQKLINALGDKPDASFVLPGYPMLLRDSTE